MINTTALQNTFNKNFELGIQAKNNGDLVEAKKYLIAAVEAMQTLARNSTGELKKIREERALSIIKVIEELPNSQSQSKPSNNSSKNAPKASNKPKDPNDTETVWQAVDVPNVRFDDIAGLDEVKQAVKRRVINPKKYKDLYSAFNVTSGGGILMYGLPGTGKTMIAKAIAAETGCKFFEVKCSDIMSKWSGEAERNIKNLFETARESGDAVIFFDEFEAIGARRTGSESVGNRIVPELLAQIQGFSSGPNSLLVLAATNRPWDIDSALMRPGRFADKLYIPLPDEKAREFLIKKEFKNVPLADNVNLDELVSFTKGFTGADICELCKKCRVIAIERAIENDQQQGSIIKDDIKSACKNAKSSVQRIDVENLKRFEEGKF